MSTAYWGQWDHSEIMSMHGLEVDQYDDNEFDIDCDDTYEEENNDSCPRCFGGGCNYCLML